MRKLKPSTYAKRIKAFAEYLENPKLKQARGWLRSTSTPAAKCCLGHACDFWAKQTKSEVKWRKERKGDYFFLGDGKLLPSAVRDWFGFADKNPTLPNGNSAADYNDAGHNFKEIAEQFKKLAENLS